MTTRSLLSLSVLPLVLAGAALSAYAQSQPSTQAPTYDKSMSSKEKAASSDPVFMKADANHDGKVSKEEAAKVPALNAKFQSLDKNHDGTISADEYSASPVSEK